MKTKERNSRLGLMGLIAIVFSSMVGGGIFNIAQNMASTAGLGAVVLAWIITGLGMVFLVLTFKMLSDRYPHLNQGLYQYSREGFGNYAGFNVAWGYWLCVVSGNVAFVIMLNDALGAFFPILLQHEWESVVICEAIVWTMFFIVKHGVMTASFINTIMTFLKFGAIIVIIVILFVFIRFHLLFSDIWADLTPSDRSLGSFWSQVMGTMFITMFCFVGIEGGLMLSSYAKRNNDVGKASVIGFYLALAIYALISILCYGIRSRDELATLPDPSLAYVLRLCCGDWAYYFVICTVIVSIMAAFISWTLLCSQAPFGAAKAKIFPSFFLHTNRHGVPVNGLAFASGLMSVFIIVVCMAPDVYMAGLNLTTVMVLPAYLLCGAFLWIKSNNKYPYNSQLDKKKIISGRIIGVGCVIYCLWCILAGNFLLFLTSSLLYLAGFSLYYIAYRQNAVGNPSLKLLSTGDQIAFASIIAASAVSIGLICTGYISLS